MKKIFLILFLLLSTPAYPFMPTPHSSHFPSTSFEEEIRERNEQRYIRVKNLGFNLKEPVIKTNYIKFIYYFLVIIILCVFIGGALHSSFYDMLISLIFVIFAFFILIILMSII